MFVSVFFDRKIANEDNQFLEKLELNRVADLNRWQRYELPDLTS